jgi:hypothetical protein
MAENLYAGSSAQAYPGDLVAYHTHADADGFLDYVDQFHAINFHARDQEVREWRYDTEFDNWQDRLGMDSVRVFYHAGHGGMSDDGTYFAAMGREWSDMTDAVSTLMTFGNQRLRYLFLHTCESLQVRTGQDPIRTWAQPNQGARMIFGFHRNSLDVSDLGSGFFREWNTGKSFSQSWLDSSLSISHNQMATATACGSSAEDARNRLFNERLFAGGSVSRDWYWWRWAGLPDGVDVEVHTDITVPHAPGLRLELARREASRETAARVAEKYGVRAILATSASPFIRPVEGRTAINEPRAVVLPDGSSQVFLAEPDRGSELVAVEEVRAAAERIVEGHDAELTLDRITADFHTGAHREGEAEPPDIAYFTAHYRQVVEGELAVMGGDGHLRIGIDRSGRVYHIDDRTVRVTNAEQGSPSSDEVNVEELLADAQAQTLGCAVADCEVTYDPREDEIGYRFRRGEGVLVARREVDVRCGRFTIRHAIEAPI